MDKWIEIDLEKIANNYREARKNLAPETKVLAVVKADAYGHGLVQVSKTLEEEKIDYLGVTDLEEALLLREAEIKTPILVFTTPLKEDFLKARDYDLTLTINSLEALEEIIAKDLDLKIHLKVETGLGRTGLSYEEIGRIVEVLKNKNKTIIEGIYTHLATSMWKREDFCRKQFAVFQNFLEAFQAEGIDFSIKHICNSKAIKKFPKMHLDMVRMGTVLYGQDSCGLEGNFLDAWTLKAKIVSINNLRKGHSIGYERTYRLKRDSRVGLIPLGFYHGFSTEPINYSKDPKSLLKLLIKDILRFLNHPRVRQYAFFKGNKIAVIGRVGMQLTTLDLTDYPEIKTGDTVCVSARRTGISPNIPKVFLHKKS